jgi:hypothetical protein
MCFFILMHNFNTHIHVFSTLYVTCFLIHYYIILTHIHRIFNTCYVFYFSDPKYVRLQILYPEHATIGGGTYSYFCK